MLIVLTGNDGAGKSTQISLINKYLKDKGHSVGYIHFPVYGNNEFSELISKFLRGEFGTNPNPYFIANIYAMDRFMFKDELQRLIRENDFVIVDRYVNCNIAFQCAKLENTESDSLMKWIMNLEFNFLQLPIPDLNIFLDVPIEIIKKRLSGNRTGADRDYLNGEVDIHEADIDLQIRVREKYLKLSHIMENYHIISTYDNRLLTPSEIFNKIKNLI